jgi:hypothetical protein
LDISESDEFSFGRSSDFELFLWGSSLSSSFGRMIKKNIKFMEKYREKVKTESKASKEWKNSKIFNSIRRTVDFDTLSEWWGALPAASLEPPGDCRGIFVDADEPYDDEDSV